MTDAGSARLRATLRVLQKVRPAPLQVLILSVLGLNRRRNLEFDGHRFHIDPSSDLGRRLLFRHLETEMIAVVRKYLRPGHTFLDLGANVGFFSVMGSGLVGSSGRVIAVEPQTRILPILKENLALNGCGNCQIAEGVVSDSDGYATLHLAPSTNTGASSLVRLARYPLPTETVKSWTLATFLDEMKIGDIDLVKVDIEGAEYEVFMSAGECLRTGQIKNIALDFHESRLARRGLRGSDINDFLIACGYRLNKAHGVPVYEFAPEP